MKNTNLELLKKNSKIDQKVLSSIGALEAQLPDAAKTGKGSDYRIAPPLGGQHLPLSRRSKSS